MQGTQGIELVSALAFVGQFPIRVEYSAPFAVLRAGYADLDMAFMLVACTASAIPLLVILGYLRRSRVPAFDLERAIGRNEIKPYYQPVINLRSGALMVRSALPLGKSHMGKWSRPVPSSIMPRPPALPFR